jgi:enoyl-CoA hydratase/carnithine racemase
MFETSLRDGVLTVTLNRPPVNAISQAWLAGFHAVLDAHLPRQSEWSVLHVRSDLRLFSAGADLAEIRDLFALPDPGARMVAHIRGFQSLFSRIRALPVVSVAEVGGGAFGGGLELALACDLRVVAREAKLGLPEVKLGLVPGAGGTQRLTELCGRGIAARLILGAETLDGPEALRCGLADWVLPAAEIEAATAGIARRLAALPRPALAEGKALIAAAADPARDGYEEELMAVGRLVQDPETQRLVSAFLTR